MISPERDQSIREAAAMLDAHGFRTEYTPPDALAALVPFKHFSAPDRCVVRSVGAVEGARAELFEYDYSSTDSDNQTTFGKTLLVCLHHPWVHGGASITLDWKHWSSVAAAIDTMTMLPPFLFVRAIQSFAASRDPDHALGHPEFDRLYYVHAASTEEAARAIPPALREFLARFAFRGTLELRPGMILYGLHDACFDVAWVQRSMSYATGMLASFPPPSAHPMR